MKLTVLYDEQGRILATSRIRDLTEVGSNYSHGMVPGPGQRLLEVDLSGDLERTPPLELHKGYRIDLRTSQLTKNETP